MASKTPPKVFVSYSHRDEAYLDELLPFLEQLELNEHISLWHDKRTYSLRGHQYCDLLLTQGEPEAALQRGDEALSLDKEHGWLHAIALDHLALGRALLQLGRLPEAEDALRQALDGLRQAGAQEFLASGLLACAELKLAKDQPHLAHARLQEALRLTTRTGMRLLEADTHLGLSRLHLHPRQRGLAAARASLEKARAIIEKFGYHRRKKELTKLEQQLEILKGG